MELFSAAFVLEPAELSVQLDGLTDEMNGSDGTIDISVYGGLMPYSYVWSNRDTIEDLSSLNYGIYSVNVTDSNECVAVLDASVKGSFTDDRDGYEYLAVPIADQIWMGNNLAYLPSVNNPNNLSEADPRYYIFEYSGADLDAAKSSPYYNTYGVLYNFPAAQESCPSGWHLPTDSEWNQIEMHLGMSKDEIGIIWARGEDENVGGKLKEIGAQSWLSPNSGANNESGFSAWAAGYLSEYGTFRQMGYVAYYWTSTEINSNTWTRLLDKDGTYSSRQQIQKIHGFSVRCIKD